MKDIFFDVQDRKFRFWCNWLSIVCLLQLIAGIAIAISGSTLLLPMFLDYAQQPRPENVQVYQWIFAMFGATIAVAAITTLLIITMAFRKGEGWAWTSLLISLILWFVIDTGASVQTQFWPNVVMNGVILTLFAIPLSATRLYFRK